MKRLNGISDIASPDDSIEVHLDLFYDCLFRLSINANVGAISISGELQSVIPLKSLT